MKDDHLIQMANSIGDFFAAMPDADEARRDLAAHIHRFWEPRMRRGIFHHIDHKGGAGLRPIVLQALQAHRSTVIPAETGIQGSQESGRSGSPPARG
jgi:formate dehydrogenase subunit delta